MKRQLVVIMLATIFLFIERSACAEIQYTLTDLGTLGGATSSYATDINASGQVVGSSGWYAFLYSDGVMTNLGTLDGCTDSSASAINASGQVVGDGTTNRDAHLPFSWTAFLYSGGTMTNLGTLGGQYSFAYDINASGQVVGEAYRSSGGGGAFLYSDGLMTDLGPGEACGINDSGQVVGKGNYHAFLYSSGTITDLGTLGGSSSTGLAINASG
jgi:probable HAF family extracellular repeat protein